MNTTSGARYRAKLGAANPIARVRRWLRTAKRSGDRLPEAMALATASTDGRPSVRFVLLEAWNHRGVAFSCSRASRKAAEIAECPRAAVALYWHRAGRQVRVEGRVEEAEPAEVDRWWRRYSRAAQLSTRAAAAGPVSSRTDLVRAYRRERRRFARGKVPRPDSWRSYRIVPVAIEFWQQRPHHLHHRERFERKRGRWTSRLLVP